MVKARHLTKGEKLIYGMAFLCLILTVVLKVFCGAAISHLSMSVEKIDYEINSQEKTNESLVMQINELTSFENVKEVVSEMGLAYNNENIIVVNE